ncbi:MAG TPA: class I SAM-dependent methyltransferase [Stellaceae bacterium]|nr:class I SAM-dependent methyltransferase [Stellaceae bacterium]
MTDTGTASTAAAEDQVAYWNGRAGERWVHYQEQLDQVFGGIAQAALRHAGIDAGARAIDIGCGCGGTLIELARRAGPTGRVTALDVSAPMLDRARQRAATLTDAAPIDFLLADAATHAFPSATIDHLFSRFGVMFFDDPVAAFTNLRGALRPGGRLTFACWRAPRDNPWAMVPLHAAYKHVPKMDPVDPEAPGPYAFAEADRVRGILTAAGFTGIDLSPLDLPLDLGAGGGLDAAAELAQNIGPASRALRGADDATVAEVQVSIREALTPFVDGSAVRLVSAVWLVTAGNP